MKLGRRIFTVAMILALLLSDGSVLAAANTLTMPEALQIIDEEAFYGDQSIDKVELGDNVEEIRAKAFANSSLSEINLPDSLTFIADDALDGPDKVTVTANDGSYAYDWAVSNGYISQDGEDAILESSHPYQSNANETWTYTHSTDAAMIIVAFSDETEFENNYDTLTITDSKGNESVYSGTDLAGKEIVLPGNSFSLLLKSDGTVEKYGYKITGVTALSAEEYAEYLEYKRLHPFITRNLNDGTVEIIGYEGEDNQVIIPDAIDGITVTSIGEKAFYCHDELTGVVIPNSVTNIGIDAFWCCWGLSSITIPNGVSVIGSGAFSNCDAILYADMDSNAAKQLSKKGYTFRVSGTKYNLKYLYQNDDIVGLEILNADNDVTDVTIPDGVTHIGHSAFFCAYNLTAVTIPESIICIDDFAFYECNNLTEIAIPEGVTIIGDSAFSGCSKLTGITIPHGVTSISNSVFYGCSSLTEIEIPDEVVSIGAGAFEGLSSLTDITIPESVISIGAGAFQGCSKLTKVTIPDSVTSISDNTFHGCNCLKEVYVPNDVTSIGEYAFAFCSDLEEITIPDSVTMICDGTFQGCKGLTSINIPDGVTSIGICAFSGCENLSEINIPDGVVSIGWGAFEFCNLSAISIPNGVTSIDMQTFWYCSNLTGITIPESVTSIGDSAFYCCSKLKGICIPHSVTSIGDYAFYSCYDLTRVYIGPKTTSIGDKAFLCFKNYQGTFYNADLTIYGEESSYAETYANEHEINFSTEAMLGIESESFSISHDLQGVVLAPDSSNGSFTMSPNAGKDDYSTLHVKSNTDWTVVASDESWVDITKTDGYTVRMTIKDVKDGESYCTNLTFNTDTDTYLVQVSLDKTNAMVATLTLSDEAATVGSIFGVTVSASGGMGSYKYAYQLLNNGEIIQQTAYDTMTYYSFVIQDDGIYSIRVYVKDSSGAVIIVDSDDFLANQPDSAVVAGQVLVSEEDYYYDDYGNEGVTVTITPVEDTNMSINATRSVLKANSTVYTTTTDKDGKWHFQTGIAGAKYRVSYEKNNYQFESAPEFFTATSGYNLLQTVFGTPTDEAVEPDAIAFNTYNDRDSINITKLSGAMVINWPAAAHAVEYIYSVKLLDGHPNSSDDEHGVSLARNITTKGREISISKAELQSGKWLKVWVASVSVDGLRANNTIYLYLCDSDMPGEVIFNNFVDKDTLYIEKDISNNQLEVTWQPAKYAVNYLVTAKVLKKEPTAGSNDEEIKLLYYRDDYDSITIGKADLVPGTWLKVAVGAVNAAGFERWTVISLYIESEEPDPTITEFSELDPAWTSGAAYQNGSNTSAYEYVKTRINSMIYQRKAQEQLNAGKAVVFMFEGAGANDDTALRKNALCIVVKNNAYGTPEIVYHNEYCSTIPDIVNKPTTNPKYAKYQSAVAMGTVRDGVYSLYRYVDRNGNPANYGEAPALSINNTGDVPCVRFKSPDDLGYLSTADGILLHRRYGDPITNPASRANSLGCFLIGNASGYYDTLQAFVSNVCGNLEKTGKVGIVIVDRVCAADYLQTLYGRTQAGKLY